MAIKHQFVKKLVLFFYILFYMLSGCKKLIEVPPPANSLSSENVYTTDATAASILTAIYAELSISSPVVSTDITGISLTSGLSCDELSIYGGSANANSFLVPFYLNRLSPGIPSSPGSFTFDAIYNHLYTVNIALEKLSVSNSLTPSVKRQLMGEAKFMRGFFYFYLANLYGAIPLTTTSDYMPNNELARSLPSIVYQQVIADLTDASVLLNDDYVSADAKSYTIERVRPNKSAASALLARAYLYSGVYDSAEVKSTSVINDESKYSLTTLDSAFLKNSNEAVWQLQPVNAGWNTEDARVFILPSLGPSTSTAQNHPVYLSPQLLFSFEAGDRRRAHWVDSVQVKISTGSATFYYPYKYKSAILNAPVTEYLIVLRLAEQYLIRAEARAQQNNIAGAQSDLNRIRMRAGLSNTTASDRNTILTAILHERQVELFTEWGHRWLDLKRTGNIDGVMNTVAPAKGTSWSTNWQLYPIPAYDIYQDPHLTQNLGY